MPVSCRFSYPLVTEKRREEQWRGPQAAFDASVLNNKTALLPAVNVSWPAPAG
jgi:hypothetical protein